MIEVRGSEVAGPVKNGSGPYKDPEGYPKPTLIREVPESVAGPLCDWLCQGKTLSTFCEQPGMPTLPTIRTWREKNKEFHERVNRAMEIGYDTIADQVLTIADSPQFGEVTIKEPSANRGLGRTKIIVDDMINHRRLQVDARLRLLACWYPKRYGPKAQIEHSGQIGLAEQMKAAQARIDNVRDSLPPPQRLTIASGDGLTLPAGDGLTKAVAEVAVQMLQPPILPLGDADTREG